jgi:replicative DNA helicase
MRNTTTEEAALGVLLSPGDHYKEIVPQLNVNLFTQDLTIKVFKIIDALFKEGKTPNMINLFTKGKMMDLITALDIPMIASWTTGITYNEPINEYVDELKDGYIKRQVSFVIAQESMGLLEKKSGAEIAMSISTKMTELLDTNASGDELITLSELTSDERHLYYDRSALAASGKTSGLHTGVASINKYTGGWQNEFIIIAARPSMGKTALALFHGVKSGEPGIYFNLEMNKSQLAQRLILQHTDNIEGSHLRDGTMTKEEILEFERTIGNIENIPFTIYDKARCGVHQAIRVMRQQHRKGKCNWAIIDYLQLMTLEGSKGMSRENEIAEISRALKAAQKELNIPIIALAQLNRDCEKRPDKKPLLSDLRESGSMEQDADTVAFIYRPAYYGLQKDDGTPYTNEIFYLFEKHRHGATGSVEFRHNYNLSQFFAVNDYVSPLPVPVVATDFRSFTDPQWDRNDEMI